MNQNEKDKKLDEKEALRLLLLDQFDREEEIQKAWNTWQSQTRRNSLENYEIDHEAKKEFFNEVGLPEICFKVMILGEYRYFEDMAYSKANGLLGNRLGGIISQLKDIVKKTLTEDEIRSLGAPIEINTEYNDWDNPYNGEDNMYRIYEDSHWIIGQVNVALDKTIKSQEREKEPKVTCPCCGTGMDKEFKEQYFQVKKELNPILRQVFNIGQKVIWSEEGISPEQIAYLRKIAGEMEDLELTHRAFAQKLGERHFDFDERAAIKDCMNSVLNHNKMPFFLAITLLKEALAMLEILWADTKLYSNKVGIIAPRSEMDAATLVVWEILEVLGVSPRDHYGALAMHYLGYEELLPNGRDKDSCSIVNRWSTRHSRAKAKRPEVYARLKNILDKVKLS